MGKVIKRIFVSSGRFITGVTNYFYGFLTDACFISAEAAAIVSDRSTGGGRLIRKRQDKLGGVRTSGISRLTHLSVFISGVLLAGSSFAQPADYRLTSTQFALDIPATNAADALNSLAEQTDVILLFPYQDALARQSNALKGQYDLLSALSVLLEGSGLEGGLSENGAIKISLIEEVHQEDETLGREQMNTRNGLLAAFFGALAGGGMSAPVIAQENASVSLEEILVTGRKREESLTDVPVSISVMNQDFIGEAGIFSTQDMFDAAVGFEYDSGWGSRNTSKPGVRGVQGNGLGVTQQKMNSFLDGFPLVGQQGSITFNDVAAVEMYRGPQSAAFGRATFAGAINYVSRNPTQDFEAEVSAGFSDLGRQEFYLALGGPITDTLGYTLDISSDSFDGPDEWTSSQGDYALSSNSTNYASAKLVWEPTDAITAKFRAIRHRADDIQGNQLFLDQTELENCSNYSIGSTGQHLYYSGDVTAGCNFTIPATGIPRSFDLTELAGLSPGDVNYDLYFAYSNFDPYAKDERDRYHVELDFGVGEGTIQVLGMYSEEYFEAWRDGDNTAYLPGVLGGPNAHEVVVQDSAPARPTGPTPTILEKDILRYVMSLLKKSDSVGLLVPRNIRPYLPV